MKTLNSFKSILLITIITSSVTFTSCKKEEQAAINNTTTTDVASLAVGNYIGSGTDDAGNNFVNKVIKVSKVNDNRVKIEAVSHTFITTFEVNVMGMPTGPTGDGNDDTGFAVRTDVSPVTIGFDCPSGQSFGGTKQ